MDIILGIESSCDDTAFAIYSKSKGLLAHKINQQISLHSQFGGVVPELASREHVIKLIPLLKSLLQECNLTLNHIDAIAYTKGPGLVGSLLVGATFAKTLAATFNIPSIGVHHLEGHIMATFLDNPNLKPPFLTLLVSGGHTAIIAVKAHHNYELIGETLDDAAGEAFDKAAKILELGYPGGPAIAKLALQGIDGTYKFPRPMYHSKELDFSFSGLKTYTLNTYTNSDKTLQTKANIAKEFEQAATDSLIRKVEQAIKITDYKQIVLAGGVAANLCLRNKVQNLSQKYNLSCYYPRIEFCTDNAAMIAYTGAKRLPIFGADTKNEVTVKPKWNLSDINLKS